MWHDADGSSCLLMNYNSDNMGGGKKGGQVECQQWQHGNNVKINSPAMIQGATAYLGQPGKTMVLINMVT